MQTAEAAVLVWFGWLIAGVVLAGAAGNAVAQAGNNRKAHLLGGFILFVCGIAAGWAHWQVVVVAVLHVLWTSFWKERSLPRNSFVILAVAVLYLGMPQEMHRAAISLGEEVAGWLRSRKGAVFIAGCTVATLASGAVVERLMRERAGQLGDAVPGNGLLIGRLERFLVFILVLENQFSAIGFLLAAKSVMRLPEASNEKNRGVAEFVIIGTLYSFSLAIVVGLIVRHLIK